MRLPRLDRRLEDGAGLHLGDLGIGDRQAAAAEAEHRVEFGKLAGAVGELARIGVHRRGDLGDLFLGVRQELVQRRIEQADRHRQAAHDLEQLDEVVALHRQQLGERGAAGLLVVGEDHLAHGADAVLVEEHVLGAAEADAFGPEAHGDAARRSGVSALARTFSLRTASAQPISVANSPDSAGSLHRDLAGQHLAGRAVDGDDVALLAGDAAGGERVRGVVDADRAGAGDAGLAHAARHHRGVGGHAAAGGEDALGGVHAVDVLGARFDAHQDHLAPLRLQQLGFVGGEHDFAGRGAGRGRQAGARSPCARPTDRWSDGGAGRASRDRRG